MQVDTHYLISITNSNINPDGIEFLTDSLPDATVGNPYRAQIITSSNSVSTSLSIVSGALPNGMVMDSFGNISGTSSQEGVYRFTVLAQTASGIGASNNAAKSYTLNVNPVSEDPTIVTTSLKDGAVGTIYSDYVLTTGFVGPKFVVSSGGLPSGLTLDVDTGEISGTPTIADTSNFIITISDSNNSLSTKQLSIVVNAASSGGGDGGTTAPDPEFTANLNRAAINVPYVGYVLATGLNAPVSYALTLGALPAGLTLNTVTGGITGTPTSAGSFDFVIVATDADRTTLSSGPLNITVVTGADILTTSLNDGYSGITYSDYIVTSGFVDPITYTVASGGLPPGLTLNSSTGQISGTPTTQIAIDSGDTVDFNFTIRAADSSGNTLVSDLLTITIKERNSVVDIVKLPDATNGTPYSSGLLSNGGLLSPVTFAVVSGQLPVGLAINPNTGEITGTPNDIVRVYNFVVSATGTSAPGGTPSPYNVTYSIDLR